MATSVGIVLLVVAVLAGQALVVRHGLPSLPEEPGPLRRWLQAPRNRWLVLAVAVGALVRVVWVVWATKEPPVGSDAWEYLRTAEDFADGYLPRFGGRSSAHYSPGYPLLLAPLFWISRATDVASPVFLASLVNAVAGATTVVSTAYLADRWIGPRTRNLAAWAMALAPAHVYWTSTQHAETVHTALVLAAVAAATAVLRRFPAGGRRARWLLPVGVLVGATAVTRTPGLLVLVVVLLAAHRIDGGWRSGLRAVAWTFVGALVVLVPVAVRNGVQVGVWSPTNTSNAVGVCLGNHPEGDASFLPDELTSAMAEDCYRYSPYDDPETGQVPEGIDFELRGVDEPRWYQETTRRGLGFIVEDPGTAVTRGLEKLAVAYRDEADALPAASNYSQDHWAGSWETPLDLAADLWLWAVLVFAAVGLLLVPACRQASPIWVVPPLVTLVLVLGTSFPHYRHMAIPFLVVLAAGGVVGAVDRLRAGGDGQRSAQGSSALPA